MKAFAHGRAAFAKIVRFAGVGLASSAFYAVAVWVATAGLEIKPDLSAILGYGVVIPFNFLSHRCFTFHSRGGVGGDVSRYAMAQGLGILTSFGAMAVCVDALRLPYAFGIGATIVLVPVLTYLLLDRWVFAAKTAAAR